MESRCNRLPESVHTMSRSFSSAAVLAMLLAVLGAGCHRHHVVTAPAQSAVVRPSLGYCWWAVLQTTLPPDSVAAHFQRGYTALGLTGATWTHSADTAWAHAGPTPLVGRSPAGATYESGAVAYSHGDSTHFRYYVAINPPPQGWQPADSLVLSGRTIGFCGEVNRAADFRWSGPREPTGEESLAVWRRRP